MSKTLVIAEKPSVARDIAGVLGVQGNGNGCIEDADYVISWAIGHLVVDCAPEEQNPAWGGSWSLENLPMIPEGMKQKANDKTKAQYNILKKHLNSSEVGNVICATDAAREGVHIFDRIYKESGSTKPYKFLWASDMTSEGLRKAFANLLPASDKKGVSNAGWGRSAADWLVGMNFTRLYTIKCNDLVSIGRVQTPVLKMLVDRALEIKNFKTSNYWEIAGHFMAGNKDFNAQWYADPFKQGDERILEEETAQKIVARCSGKPGQVDFIESKPGQKKPPLPFDSTSIQREANKKFGFRAQQTLDLCQALYEIHKVLTYPRTDSRYISEELLGEIGKHFEAAAANYAALADLAVARVGEGNKFECVNNKKIADHHAIIPTSQAADKAKLSDDEWKIYDLATRRFLAAFLPSTKLENSTLWITVGEDRFKTSGKAFLDKGWLVAEPWRSSNDSILPKLSKGETVNIKAFQPEKKTTKPPSQHTENSLLGLMETAGKFVKNDELAEALKERGIGTPVTRPGIIERIVGRKYVDRIKKGNKESLIPTEKGIQVIQTVDALHPEMSSPELTGDWEKRLRDMENGEVSLEEFLSDIRNFVSKGIAKGKAGEVLYKGSGRGDRVEVGTCPICGKPVCENKKAFGCSGYPKCKFYIWKELCEGKISALAAKQLLTTGKTAKEIKFISPNTKKSFKARLKLMKNEEAENLEYKLEFVFKKSKKKK